MAIFATFIKPGPSGFDAWRRLVAFGDVLPSRRCSGLVHLEVDDPAQVDVFAAFAGKITTRPPTGFLQLPLPDIVADEAGGATLTLFLEPTAAKFDPEWISLSAAIASRFDPTADPPRQADSVLCFIYRNVDSARAKALLAPLLKTSKAADDPARLWPDFLAGHGGILVTAGAAIGAAGPAAPGPPPAPPFRIVVGLSTRYGMFDPGTLYQTLSATTDSAALAALLGQHDPLIDRGRPLAAVGAERLWPWSALLAYKLAKGLPYTAWRQLGNLQKNQYLDQLMARVRPSDAPAGTIPFEYDVDDMANLFQLEAVTEFYINASDPWADAGQLLSGDEPTAYRTINLLTLYGSAAQVNGTTVTLDDQFEAARDLGLIVPGRDTLLLEAEPARPHKQFRVLDVDRSNRQLKLDAAPGIATSAWRMFHNPTLVMIDVFGARVRGERASSPAARVLKLEGLNAAQLNELRKVNPQDTVALATVAQGTPLAARITEPPLIDAATLSATLQLDRSLTPAGGSSAWAIPAGVGGLQGPIDRSIGPASTQFGWDNYDGMLFLVAGGEMRCVFAWTSFGKRTPRFNGDRLSFSSIKGNRAYRISSIFSGKRYINLSFTVSDAEGLLWGDVGTPDQAANSNRSPSLVTRDLSLSSALVAPPFFVGFLQPKPPRAAIAWVTRVQFDNNRLVFAKDSRPAVPAGPAPYWIEVFDGTRKNRRYASPGFEANDTRPALRPKQTEAAGGMAGIRIHRGETQTVSVSEGCQVSPWFKRLRMALIAYHKEANATYYAENADDPHLDRVREALSDQNEPPLMSHYLKLRDELAAKQDRINQLLADPLSRALNAVLTAGSDEQQLQQLRQAVDDFQQQLRVVQDAGDVRTEQEILSVLDTLTSLAADVDVATAVQWAQDNADLISRLRTEMKEMQASIDAEVERWGWNDAIQGDYWVVRPDERHV